VSLSTNKSLTPRLPCGRSKAPCGWRGIEPLLNALGGLSGDVKAATEHLRWQSGAGGEAASNPYLRRGGARRGIEAAGGSKKRLRKIKLRKPCRRPAAAPAARQMLAEAVQW